ncbi:MAG: 2Fe-2S iron-sulfur cluster-binding protein [Myxococcota bacterium]|nr:2Fe-2S iron-sulfur cluster-binding protein [Myxococcota bacterium]
MPTFKLDGQEIAFEPGDTILRAAWKQGIEIPHYCWHPGLSVAANCRMCLVEIKSARPMALPILAWDEKKKDYVEATKNKLQPSCQIEVTDGMEVVSKGEHVLEAQAAVQEFLLLNHPVDCPICDQAGECKLQDYWLTSQKTLKRKDTEPVHKPKAVRFGPTIVYDAERCIMCTRCIRFCDEVVGDHVLDMRERGNKNEIVLSPGRELDHDYTLMTEHVCPVGALTSKDFRFKARVWFLRSTPSVCGGCATGCNTWVDYDPRNQRVYRLRPRDNADVNEFWMCDDGMMTYKRFHEDRVLTGRVRQEGRVVEVPRDVAIDAAARVLEKAQRIAIVFSAQHSNEDNFVLAKLGREHLGGQSLYLAALPGWKGDAILRSSDNNPNRAGATAIGGGALKTTKELADDVAAQRVDAILSLGWAASETAEQLAGLASIPHVNLSSNIGPLVQVASVVVPVATHAEASGTFVNAQGKAQQFQRAVQAPMGIKSAWETLVEIGTRIGREMAFARLPEVRAAMPAHTAPTKSMAPPPAAPPAGA